MGGLNKQLDPAQTGFLAEKLEADLRRRVVGQGEAIQQIVNTYQTFLAGMSGPGRPVGSFLFLGPTGSGKTRMVEAVAESLVGDMRAVIKIDCAEFQQPRDCETDRRASRIPGPPGNPSTTKPGSLESVSHPDIQTEFRALRRDRKGQRCAVEPAVGHPRQSHTYSGRNRRVDFSRAIIFMTSNLGAAEMASILRPNFGFAASDVERRRATESSMRNWTARLIRWVWMRLAASLRPSSSIASIRQSCSACWARLNCARF